MNYDLISSEETQTSPGWPRPYARYEPDRRRTPLREASVVPVPWILDADESGPAWTTFKSQRSAEAHAGRLCTVCGDPMQGAVLLGAVTSLGDDALTVARRMTNGPGCHPRCMALAAQFCPHFNTGDADVVAFLYLGSGTGYVEYSEEGVYSGDNEVEADATPVTRAQVKAMAAADPLGLASGQPLDPDEVHRHHREDVG